MLDDPELVVALQQRLEIHRRTLDYLERQRAQFGAFTPAFVWHQFDETRAEIAQVKRDLRAFGVDVPDLAGDTAAPAVINHAERSPPDTQLLLSIYRRMLIDQLRYLPLAGMSLWEDLNLQLADLYIERTLIELEPPFGFSARVPAEKSFALPELLQHRGARVLLLGEPGSGRTTCLHMLALSSAKRAGDESAADSPAPLPIFLNARDIIAALEQGNAMPDEQGLPAPTTFWSAIERWLQYSDLSALVPSIQQLLDRGECLVLIDDLDGLGEVSQRSLYFAALGRFVARYPDNRYVLASGELSTRELASLASFARYRLAQLDQAQVDSFVDRWYQACARRADSLMLYELSERIAVLKGVLHGDARLRELAATPRGLALCVFAHAEGYNLPIGRDVVLRRLAELLLKRWKRLQPGALNGAAKRRFSPSGLAARRLELLAFLGLEFQSRLEPSGGQPSLTLPELRALLSESRAMASIERRRGTDVLPDMLKWGERYGLLAAAEPGSYTMPHRQLRDFFAAHALARLPDFVARAYARRGDPHWHETLRLAAGEVGRGPALSGLAELLGLLLNSADPDSAQHDLILAAELLVEQGERSPLVSGLQADIRSRLMQLIQQESTSIAERVHAGLLLGRLGDPRFAGVMPPLAWVEAGSFLLGGTEGYPDEGPMQLLDLPTFAIGVFQVTNQEYALFLSENAAHPAPRYWYDPRYNNPASPVVGVTWHDAVAYCAWLTRRNAQAGLLQPGLVFRLPLESEWEKAAAWDEQRQLKRRYPWGDAWDSARANTVDGRGEWITSPVGCYPSGVSAYGLHDCIGNVWEWTASEYASYPGSLVPFYEAGRYTLRGSSCASNPTHARCTYRSRLPPDYWRYHLGFRVVLAKPLP